MYCSYAEVNQAVILEQNISVFARLSFPQTISYIDLLQEYCQKLQVMDPDYKVIPTQRGGGFYCTVSIENKSYTGAIRLDKEEAKKSAAVEFAVRNE